MANLVTAAPAARSSIATLVIVGPPERLEEASGGLSAVREAGAVRPIMVSTAAAARPFNADGAVTVIEQLPAQYLNNAIAALRLSSLPTVIWWRGGPAEELDGVAPLADRLVLDADDPLPLWRRAAPLFERTAMTDLRWARLTRWRAAMAQFFDLAPVRETAPSFTRLTVAGSDRPTAALYAGWIASSLGWDGKVAVDLPGGSRPIERVVLEGGPVALTLATVPSGTCMSSTAEAGGREIASRVLALGEQTMAAQLRQELRVRSRDLAFESALGPAVALLDRQAGA